MSRRTKIILGGALLAVTLFWLSTGLVASYFISMPHPRTIGERDSLGGKPVENVAIRTSDGVTLSAWHVRADPDRAVILLAGIGCNRRFCVSRGEYFLGLGYSVLLPDLRGTGESERSKVALGWLERFDLAACFDYLRGEGYRHVGADGVSLGAATIAYALQELDDLAFIILESSYDSLETAVNNRLALFHVPRFLGAPTRWLYPLWVGARPGQLRPVDCMPLCKVPALIMCGDSEGVVKVSEARGMFEQCASDRKRFVLFKGGKHQDFLGRFPEQFKKETSTFLQEASAAWAVPEAA